MVKIEIILDRINSLTDHEAFNLVTNFVNNIRYKSENTIKSYLYDIYIGLKFFAATENKCTKRMILDINQYSFRKFCASRTNLCNASQQRIIASWKAFMKSNKMNNLQHFKTPKSPSKAPRPINGGSIHNLINSPVKTWLDARNNALFTILYCLGLRISEALSIKVEDIQHKKMIQIKGKNNKHRLLPIIPIVHSSITTYLVTRPFEHEYLFLGKSGVVLSQQTASQIFRSKKKQYTLPRNITLHSLRHSFATDLLRNGCDVRVLQKLLGHANIATTANYTKIQDIELEESFIKTMQQINKSQCTSDILDHS